MLSGIVDDAVESPESLYGLLDRLFQLEMLTDVAWNKNGLARSLCGQLLGQLLPRLGASCKNTDEATFTAKYSRTAFPNSFASAGDDDHFSFKSHPIPSLFLRF
jgi:hypothetical protein